MKKIKTIDLKGNSYAKVADRLKEFRQDCPNGKIETTPSIQEDGQVLFKAYILKDKADEFSAEATGHALGGNTNPKAFEKLETIAVGRALAMLGYASDGEIASGEEMEEFLQYQDQKKEAMITDYKKTIEKCKTLEELKTAWGNIPGEYKPLVKEIKDTKKATL